MVGSGKQRIMRGMDRTLSTGLVIGTLAVLFAACGSGAPEPGSAVKVGELRTEYRTKAGTYVGCNNTLQLGGGSTTRTSFALRFTLAGRTDAATLALKGTTSSQYDAFYTQTLTASQLARLQTGTQDGGTYRAVLSANASSSLYLSQPSGTQTLTVGPAAQAVKVKLVRVFGLPTSSMYAQVSADGPQAGSSVAASTDTIPVYERCTVLADTGSDRL